MQEVVLKMYSRFKVGRDKVEANILKFADNILFTSRKIRFYIDFGRLSTSVS